MTIDIERLKTDLDYWNEVAPDGADAVLVLLGNVVDWYCKETREVYFHTRGEWAPSRYFEQRADDLIPRPTPAASNHSPTWNGEGLPPVGVECEYDDCDNGWVPTVILAHHPDGHAVWHESVKPGGFSEGRSYSTDSVDAFRPLKTEKERVVEAVAAKLEWDTDFAKMDLEELYDAGALKMPGGE